MEKRILYSGPLAYGQTCEMRRGALERLGFNTIKVDYTEIFSKQNNLLKRIQWLTRFGPMVREYNIELLKQLYVNCPEFVWVDKSIFINSFFFEEAKRKGVQHIIHYSPDNYFLKQNNSRHLWRSLPYFSLVITTKKNNVESLKARGARKTFLSGNAYDPATHKSLELSEEEKVKYGSDVSFIGRWEPDREILLMNLIKKGFQIKIWSSDWNKAKNDLVKHCCTFHSPVGIEYSKVINASKINIGLLSKLAGDTITQRSIEIPACGSFMLAERTPDHSEHFKEGKEAEFYSSFNEMEDKINYYLQNDSKRIEIAKKGLERCISSKYSYDDRLREILALL